MMKYQSGLTNTRIREFWQSTDMGGAGAGSVPGVVAEIGHVRTIRSSEEGFEESKTRKIKEEDHQIAASNSSSNR